MESEEEGQWSWWQPDNPEDPQTAPVRAALLVDPAEGQPDPGSPLEPERIRQSNDRVRIVLIGLVAVLSITLAGLSYARVANIGSVSDAAAVVTSTTTTADPTTTTADPGSTAEPATPTSAPTTAAADQPQTTQPVSTTATTAPGSLEPPSPPQDVEVISTSSTGAEIRWRSEECAGSRYRVGEFDEGTGGYPDVDRCWFNHVILAGDPSFSPPLTPNTSYTVTIQAVSRAGVASEPVEVQFTTNS